MTRNYNRTSQSSYTKSNRARLRVAGGEMQYYVRYYRKSSGDDFSTQVMRCDQYEARMELTLDTSLGDNGVYEDKDISGGREDRSGYQRLLRDIITGKLDGKFIVARDQERITRGKSSVFEEFAYNCEKSGVRVFEATTGREIKDDLTSGVLAVIARQDRKRIGVLQQGRKEWHALEGHPPTGRWRRFGYTEGYAEIVWEEAKTLRRMRKWARAGVKAWSIAKRLKMEGVLTVAGNPFQARNVVNCLTAPEYVAIRTYDRDLEVDGVIIPAGEKVADGQWPAIFTEKEHAELVEIFSGNRPFSTDNGKTKYLLIGILVCDECGLRLSTAYAPKLKDGTRPKVYRCDPSDMNACGKVTRNMKAVDDFMLALTYRAIKRLPKTDNKPKSNKKEIEALDQRIRDARNAYKRGDIDIADFSDIKRDLQGAIKELTKQEKSQPLPVDSAESFLQADIDQQRATIRRLWPVIGVKSAGKGQRFKREQLVFPGEVAS